MNDEQTIKCLIQDPRTGRFFAATLYPAKLDLQFERVVHDWAELPNAPPNTSPASTLTHLSLEGQVRWFAVVDPVDVPDEMKRETPELTEGIKELPTIK